MKIRHIFSIFILSLLLTTGCYDWEYPSPSLEFNEQANCTIGSLRQMCEEGCQTITSDLVCVGRVVSYDFAGNFDRTLVVEDSTGAVEIKVGMYNNSATYPVGMKVALRLKEHAIKVEDGVVVVGLPPLSYDESPRELTPLAIIDRLLVRSIDVASPEPLSLTIPSLSSELGGRFVEVEGLLHSPIEECTTETTMEGYHRFIDGEGNTIYSLVCELAKFKDETLPTSSLAIRGILYHAIVSEELGLQYIIKPRTKDDFATAASNI